MYQGSDHEDEGDTLQHRRVLRRFWAKVKTSLGRVPFIDEAVAAYYCARDPDTPTGVKAVLLAALAYFVVPSDMVPDFLAGLGYTDDATVLLAALRQVAPHITAAHRDKARRALSNLQSGGSPGGIRQSSA